MTKRKRGKGGAPSKYRPEFCALLIEKMGEGYSIEACAGLMGVHKDTIYEWVNTIPEFSDAKKDGEAKARVFWERMGVAGMLGKVKNFNSAIWIFNMKNRFGWRDQPLPEAGDDVPEPTLNYQPRKPKE